MSYLCSYRHRSGRVCKTESNRPRCDRHLTTRTNILCINCDSRFTNSSVSICNDIDCRSIYGIYRAQFRNQKKHFNAEFAAQCIQHLENNAADMKP